MKQIIINRLMTSFVKSFSVLVIIFLTSVQSVGQIYFGIDYEPAENTLHMTSEGVYTISLKSEQNLSNPLNSTGTAQITIRFATTDSFQISNLTSLIPGVSWNKTIRVERPVEAMDYDYITFGLASLGTTQINYQKDSILPLFSFENTGGRCPGVIEIIDNQTDAFLYPNSAKLSIKNHISVLGMGGNAFAGTFKGDVNCQEQVFTNIQNLELIGDFSIYPNPATDWLNVEYNFIKAPTRLEIFDVTGKVVRTTILENATQQDNLNLNITDLAQGAYLIKLSNQENASKTIPFIKVI